MKKNDVLRTVLKALIELKAEHDAEDARVAEKLDEAIELVIEGIREAESNADHAYRALEALGRVLAAVPKIADFLDKL